MLSRLKSPPTFDDKCHDPAKRVSRTESRAEYSPVEKSATAAERSRSASALAPHPMAPPASQSHGTVLDDAERRRQAKLKREKADLERQARRAKKRDDELRRAARSERGATWIRSPFFGSASRSQQRIRREIAYGLSKVDRELRTS
jgi:hypothetical protein